MCRLTILLCLLTINGGWCEITERQYASIPPVFELDDFDRCMMLDDEALYCFFTFQLYPEHENTTSETWSLIKELSGSPKYYRHDLLRHGICLPTSCPNATKYLSRNDPRLIEEITRCYNPKYQHLGLKGEVTKIHCQTKESPYPIDFYDIAYAVVVLLFISFVIFSTFYEGAARYKSKEEYEKITETRFGRIVAGFSLTKNWNRLKTVNLDKPDVRKLRCIQGIRFYNMLLVILTHSVMAKLAVPVVNTRYTETLVDRFISIFFANGGYVVQTFFMISGWLLTYQLLTTYENKKRIPPAHLLMAFVHRYIRLTPTLAVIIGFNSTWMIHMSRGPFWDIWVGDEYRNCRNNWWTNLLYINNYVNKYNLCNPPTWYTAADTQFFIISLLLLWATWKRPMRLFGVLGLITSINIVGWFTMIYGYEWQTETVTRPDPEKLYSFQAMKDQIYHVVSTSMEGNVPGMVVGIVVGYVYYKYKDVNLFTNKWHLAAWWVVIWGLPLGIIIVPGMIMFDANYEYNPLFAAIFGGINMTVFIIGITYGMFGLTQGAGWAMNWVTEWGPTYFLGRLSYNAFLFHLTYIRVKIGASKQAVFLSDFDLFHDFVANATIAYVLALLVTLFFEMPISALQNLVLKKAGSVETSGSVVKSEEKKTK